MEILTYLKNLISDIPEVLKRFVLVLQKPRVAFKFIRGDGALALNKSGLYFVVIYLITIVLLVPIFGKDQYLEGSYRFILIPFILMFFAGLFTKLSWRAVGVKDRSTLWYLTSMAYLYPTIILATNVINLVNAGFVKHRAPEIYDEYITATFIEYSTEFEIADPVISTVNSVLSLISGVLLIGWSMWAWRAYRKEFQLNWVRGFWAGLIFFPCVLIVAQIEAALSSILKEGF